MCASGKAAIPFAIPVAAVRLTGKPNTSASFLIFGNCAINGSSGAGHDKIASAVPNKETQKVLVAQRLYFAARD